MRCYMSLVLISVVGVPLVAQGPRQAGLQSSSSSSSEDGRHWAPSFAKDTVPATHWKEGMLIGGGVGLGFWLLLAAALHGNCVGDTGHCGPSLLGVVGGVTIFTLIGGLIGSSIHKT